MADEAEGAPARPPVSELYTGWRESQSVFVQTLLSVTYSICVLLAVTGLGGLVFTGFESDRVRCVAATRRARRRGGTGRRRRRRREKRVSVALSGVRRGRCCHRRARARALGESRAGRSGTAAALAHAPRDAPACQLAAVAALAPPARSHFLACRCAHASIASQAVEINTDYITFMTSLQQYLNTTTANVTVGNALCAPTPFARAHVISFRDAHSSHFH
jgi:hypothetical protein